MKVVPVKRDLPEASVEFVSLVPGHRDRTVQTRVQTFNHSSISSFIRSFNLFLAL